MAMDPDGRKAACRALEDLPIAIRISGSTRLPPLAVIVDLTGNRSLGPEGIQLRRLDDMTIDSVDVFKLFTDIATDRTSERNRQPPLLRGEKSPRTTTQIHPTAL